MARQPGLLRRLQTVDQEVINAITHGFGLVLSLLGLGALLALTLQQGGGWRLIACGIYGVTLVMAYAASTLMHSFGRHPIRRVLLILDHSCIYLLIAGSYTPFMLISMRQGDGLLFFWIAWALATCGIAFKAIFRERFRAFSLATYLGMGWMLLLAISQIVSAISWGGVAWLIAGGLFYSVGVIFYVLERIRYFHAIWHLFVIAGSACHFVAVVLYVVPKTP